MTTSFRGRVLALLFLMALTAAACGGNGNDASSSGETTAATTTGPSSATGSTDDAGRYGGYGDGDGDGTGATGESGDHAAEGHAGATVQANNFSFDPADVEVESGEDLHLKNGNANTPHTFTVDGTDIDVNLDPLASDEVKVDLDPGTYDFHCEIHPQMTGTLTVT